MTPQYLIWIKHSAEDGRGISCCARGARDEDQGPPSVHDFGRAARGSRPQCGHPVAAHRCDRGGPKSACRPIRGGPQADDRCQRRARRRDGAARGGGIRSQRDSELRQRWPRRPCRRAGARQRVADDRLRGSLPQDDWKRGCLDFVIHQGRCAGNADRHSDEPQGRCLRPFAL